MVTVFISYARTNRDFVRRVADALTSDGRTVWIDLEDIMPSATWLNEIYAAIEGASACVVVLSPDSLVSANCSKEIAHALTNKKRIIPVVRGEVNPEDVPEPIRALHWIFMRDSDDFDAAFKQLLFALDTDLDYWHRAAQLFVRARDWQGKHRDPSILLRGADLDSAELWLADGAEKQPTPTALHTQFITASRRDVTNRQRRLLSFVSLALVLVTVLSIFAFNEAQIAQAQTLRARHNLAIALSRQLAGQSLQHVDDHPDLGLLLAVEANRRAATAEGRGSLMSALERHPRLAGYLHGYTHTWGTIALNSAGTLLAAYDVAHKTIVFWDTASRQIVGDPLPTVATSGGLAFTPDGTLLAVTTPFGVELWDPVTRQRVGIPLAVLGVANTIVNLTFSRDGGMLAVLNDDDQLVIWDMRARHSIHSIGAPITVSRLTYSLAFSPNGTVLAVGGGSDLHASNEVALWDVASHRLRTTLTTGRGSDIVNTVTYSPDGRTVAAGTCIGPDDSAVATCFGGEVHFWDVATGREVRKPLRETTDGDGIFDIAYSPDGRFIVSGGYRSSILFWDIATGTLLDREHGALASTFGNVETLALSRGGSLLATVNPLDPDIELWDPLFPHERLVQARVALDNIPDGIQDARMLPDGKTLATGWCNSQSTRAQFQLRAVATLQPLGAALDGVSPCDTLTLALSSDSQTLAAAVCGHDRSDAQAGARGSIQLWNMKTGASVGTPFETNGVCATSLALRPDGVLVAVYHGNSSLTAWKVANHQHLSEILAKSLVPSGQQVLEHLTLSADGRTLAGLVCDPPPASRCRLLAWNAATARTIAAVAVDSITRASGIALSADGKRVLAWGNNARQRAADGVVVWDIASGRIMTALSVDVLLAAAVSSDGSTLALTVPDAHTSDDRIQLWDVASNQPLGPELVPNTVYTVPVLSATGGTFVVLGAAQYDTPVDHLSSWSIDGRTLDAQACSLADRNLTAVEWGLYLGDEPYQKTCPSLPTPPPGA